METLRMFFKYYIFLTFFQLVISGLEIFADCPAFGITVEEMATVKLTVENVFEVLTEHYAWAKRNGEKVFPNMGRGQNRSFHDRIKFTFEA